MPSTVSGCWRKLNRELKQQRWRRRRQPERQKSNRFRLAKQQLCTCITFFCTCLCLANVKVPNFRFCRGREHKTTFFYFFWTLIEPFRAQPQKNSPTFDELNEIEETTTTTRTATTTWKYLSFLWAKQRPVPTCLKKLIKQLSVEDPNVPKNSSPWN